MKRFTLLYKHTPMMHSNVKAHLKVQAFDFQKTRGWENQYIEIRDNLAGLIVW